MNQQTNLNLTIFKNICRDEVSNCQSDIYLYRHRLSIIKALLAKVQSGKSEITNDRLDHIKQYLSESHERRGKISSLYYHIAGLKASSGNQEAIEAFDLTYVDDDLHTYFEMCQGYLIKSGKLITEFISLATEFLTKVSPPIIGE